MAAKSNWVKYKEAKAQLQPLQEEVKRLTTELLLAKERIAVVDTPLPPLKPDLRLIIRQTHEKQQVLFVALKNTQIEVQQFRKEVQQLLTYIHDTLVPDREKDQPFDFEGLNQLSHVYTKK